MGAVIQLSMTMRYRAALASVVLFARCCQILRGTPTPDHDPEYMRNGHGSPLQRIGVQPGQRRSSLVVRGDLRSRVRRFESYWGRFFEQNFRTPGLW